VSHAQAEPEPEGEGEAGSEVEDEIAARGLLDTSVFIARETGRALDEPLLPRELAVSAVTVAELHVGVLAAGDLDTRARRMATLEVVSDIELLVVDESVAVSWALLRMHLAEAGRRLNVNDLWIAATALAHSIPVVTQDEDFDPVDGVGGLEIVRV
jgi:predicted nucleic acid-binding protein